MAPPSRQPCGLRPALSPGKLPRSARTDHGWGWFLGAPLSCTRATCYTAWPRDGDTILPRVTGLRSAPGVPLVGPGEWCQAPGVCGRRFRSRAYGRRDPRGAPEGQQQGEGHTAVVAARAPGPPLRVVRPPRARRRRHGDLSGQGAGHLPCRVSRPVSRRHVAAGGAVGTAAASPTPRPGSSPAPARLLVLTPSSGHEGSRAQRPEFWKKVRGQCWGFSPKPSNVAALGLPKLRWIGCGRGPLLAFSLSPPPVGSRAGAPAVGGGFPVPLFRLRGGFTIPP
jgi:hypothetical protein